ncbi:hypothetical protein [Streptomyces sp. NPDC001787]|uniref:hypothetical protein n=1 Tax=Streptomyces sp. NPDC001787 TaxID=3154523 RepID=UPI00333376BA
MDETEDLPVAMWRWPSASEWLTMLGVPAVILGLMWVLFFGTFIEKLRNGEEATATGVGRCVQSQGQTTPASYCPGSWRFSDGRTSSGHIQSAPVSPGDTIFAGEGWAYSSIGPVWRTVGIFIAIGVASLVGTVLIWGSEFRDDRRRRTDELRQKMEHPPESAESSEKP